MTLDKLLPFFPLLIKGTLVTLRVVVVAASGSFVVGGLCGVLLSERIRLPLLSPIIEVMAFVARAIPFFVQLLIFYFVLPEWLGLALEAEVAACIALIFCSSGYVAQFVRAGINAIPTSQWDAATALGYGRFSALWAVILPQVWRRSLPMMASEVDSLLKSTAMISSIGIMELTRVGMNIVSREMEPIPIYLSIAAIYALLSLGVNVLSKTLEWRTRYVTSQ